MRKNSIKNTRINSEVQRTLAKIIREEIKDPRVPVMTTVMDAVVAPDLKTCKVWISVLGSSEEREDCIRGLKSAEGYIRMLLAKEMNMRNTPELTFVADHSVEYGVAMSEKIDEVMASQSHKEDENAED